MLTCLLYLSKSTVVSFAGAPGEGNEKCTLGKNLIFCASYYGTAPVGSLIPGEESPFFFDVFKIRLENKGAEEIDIRPDDFYCITFSGRAVVVDRTLYDRIVWREKLTDCRLMPGESIEKFLFFPSSRDYIRTIVHRSKPIIKLQLF